MAAPTSTVFLSIVVPAYNEEDRVVPTLEKILDYLRNQPYTAEVLVADDGSADRTIDVVQECGAAAGPPAPDLEVSPGKPTLHVLELKHAGKGSAVRQGMLAARGEYRFFCDADLSMPIEELASFLPPVLTNADVAIGSREAPGAKRYDEPPYRHLMGRVFNFLVRVVAVGGFADTQCGFKLFTGAAAKRLFGLQTMDGFGFDVEILYLARRNNYRVVEIPINWYHVENSKVRPVYDTIAMIGEAVRVRLNAWRGVYNR